MGYLDASSHGPCTRTRAQTRVDTETRMYSEEHACANGACAHAELWVRPPRGLIARDQEAIGRRREAGQVPAHGPGLLCDVAGVNGRAACGAGITV